MSPRRDFEENINQALEARHERDATTHAQFAIFSWTAFGIFAFVADKLNGLITLIIFFVAGIFIASIVSIPTYLLQRLLIKIFVKTHPPDNLVIILGYILLVVNFIWIIIVANYSLRFFNNI